MFSSNQRKLFKRLPPQFSRVFFWFVRFFWFLYLFFAFRNQLITGVGVGGVLFGGLHVSCPLTEIQCFVSLWYV